MINRRNFLVASSTTLASMSMLSTGSAAAITSVSSHKPIEALPIDKSLGNYFEEAIGHRFFARKETDKAMLKLIDVRKMDVSNELEQFELIFESTFDSAKEGFYTLNKLQTGKSIQLHMSPWESTSTLKASFSLLQ